VSSRYSQCFEKFTFYKVNSCSTAWLQHTPDTVRKSLDSNNSNIQEPSEIHASLSILKAYALLQDDQETGCKPPESEPTTAEQISPIETRI